MRALLLHCFILLISFVSYCQSGQLDRSFGKNGIASLSTGAPYENFRSSATEILQQSDGSFFLLIDNGSRLAKRKPDGSIDSSYGYTGYSRTVKFSNSSAAMQTDGKIVLAGDDGKDYFILSRINTDGSIDQSFGTNGIQTTLFEGESHSNSVAIQKDNKIVVAGYTDLGTHSDSMYFAVARYNSDGTPDITFNGSGKLTTDFEFQTPGRYGTFIPVHSAGANAIALQNDGKIVVSGWAYDGGYLRFASARYNSDGTLDSSFDSDGIKTTKIGSFDVEARSIVIQNDEKIVVAGVANRDRPSSTLVVVRYNSDGTPDSTFDVDGISVLPDGYHLGLSTLPVQCAALQSNGKIVIAGYSGTSGNSDFFAARLNTDGTLDNTFDNDGIVITDINSSEDNAGSVLIQSDGKFLIAGTASWSPSSGFYSKFVVARYNVDGTPDNSFADSGILQDNITTKSTSFTKSELQPDGKIISVGKTWNGTDYDFLVARFNNNGKVDSSFNANGQRITDLGGDDNVLSVFIQNDQKIILLGSSNSLFAMSRYNSDGTLDQTFHGDGKFILDFGLPFSSIKVQDDGKIILAGVTYDGINNSQIALVRLNSDGTPDNSFGNSGKILDDLGIDILNNITPVIQSDGKIVLAARAYINSQDHIIVVRYNANGTIDNSFASNGIQTAIYGDDNYFAESAAIQNDGKIVVAGFSQTFQGSPTWYFAARFKTNGDRDSTFGVNGFQSTLVGDEFNFGESVAINKDGKIAVGGTNDNFTVVVYNSDGSLDQKFSGDGIETTQVGTGNSTIYHLTFSDDALYATGIGDVPDGAGVVVRYVFGSGGALPVSLLDFTGTLKNKTVLLNWKIASDKDLNKFIIERSADGRNFIPLQSVAAINPVSVTRNYSITDASPLPDINYYRLQMIDDDGKFTYSNIVAVRMKQDRKISIFPNPVEKILYVSAIGNNENAMVEIIDANGRKLKTMNVVLASATSFSIDVSKLPKAVYYLVLRKASGVEVHTFIKR